MALSDTLRKVWIWSKIGLLALILIYTLFFVGFNSGEHIKLWLSFWHEPTVPMLVALLGAFLLGSLLTILVRTVFTTLRQIRKTREHDRTSRLEREIAEMRTKASVLRTREP